MAAPIYGVPPKIRQEGASLVVYDNASWFDPQTGGGTRATRYVHVWFWNGVNVFGTPTPPWNTKPPEAVQPGENAARLPLGPTNIGGRFYVVEYGGIVSPAFGDNPAAVEWGRERSDNREDQSHWGARSNELVVEPWATPPPPPPSGPTGDQFASVGFQYLQRAEPAWRAEGLPAAKIEATDAHLVNVYRALRKENKQRARVFILELAASEE